MDVFMSIVDYVPVTLFLIAAIYFQRMLYNKMSKGAFALFAAGTITVFVAGVFKATYKLLGYGFGVNFDALNKCFFPMQTVGFVLAAAGLVAMLFFKQGEGTVYSVAPLPLLGAAAWMANEEFKGTMIFVVFMVLGVAVMDGILIYIAARKKDVVSIILLSLAFVCTLGMGYLSTKEDLSDWVKEIVNMIGQGCFLAAAIWLKKKGFGAADSLKGILLGKNKAAAAAAAGESAVESPAPEAVPEPAPEVEASEPESEEN